MEKGTRGDAHKAQAAEGQLVVTIIAIVLAISIIVVGMSGLAQRQSGNDL